MKRRGKATLLRLGDFEDLTSRLILLADSIEEVRVIVANGYISFDRGLRDRHLWGQILEKDLIICLSFENNAITIHAFRVTGKGVKLFDVSAFSDERPLLAFIELVGIGKTSELTAAKYFSTDFLPYTPRPLFQQLWEQCSPIDDDDSFNRSSGGRWLCPSTSKYEISLASSEEDYEYVLRIAVFHPFGPRKAFLTLIARLDGRRVGAILVEYAIDSQRIHRASWHIFRKEYLWIRKRAVQIARIYSDPNSPHKWQVHKALLEAVIQVAPSLTTEPISMIEGVSYDYHPIALPLGFNVEVPHKVEGSFYYWKPINLPSSQYADALEVNETKAAVHHILNLRRQSHYWLVVGSRDNILRAIGKNAWALRRQPVNTGRWRSISEGHTLFFMSVDKRIRAYGKVVSTSLRYVEGLEDYPLWIDLSPNIVTDLDIDISEHINQPWFSGLKLSGIVSLPGEFGAVIKRIADRQKMEGKMWVEPNPYLLHRTEFEAMPNQVFVVQSWKLRDTVFPIIKNILNQAGYTVRYSGDRDGQVIFDDIWLMLNESEVILVDFTDKRPNVYLEYGMALVLGKPIVAITQDKDDIPSDTPNLKYIIYQDKLSDSALNKLPKAIQETMFDIQRIRDSRTLDG